LEGDELKRELETVVWCPRCRTDKYEVWRSLISPNHYEHVTVPPSIPKEAMKVCECGAMLARKR
jgi:hypothetical protein